MVKIITQKMIIVNSSVVKYKYNESIAIIRNAVNKKKKVNIINIYSHNILFLYNLIEAKN